MRRILLLLVAVAVVDAACSADDTDDTTVVAVSPSDGVHDHCDHGPTVIAVLHDLNLAARFSDVILLDQGPGAAHGPADTVLTADDLSDVSGHPIAVADHPLRPGSLILPRPGV